MFDQQLLYKHGNEIVNSNFCPNDYKNFRNSLAYCLFLVAQSIGGIASMRLQSHETVLEALRSVFDSFTRWQSDASLGFIDETAMLF